MKQLLFLAIISFITPLLMANSSGPSVLFEKDGTVYHGVTKVSKAKNPEPNLVYVTAERYISEINYSPLSAKIEKNDLIYETNFISGSINNKEVILKKGMIVLDAEKNPALIEAVFPNGMVSLRKLEINRSSGSRLDQNNNFAPKKGQTIVVTEATDITAIEEKCFLGKYCKDQTFKSIEGIPLCEFAEIKGLNFCGRTDNALIRAVFSDGTLLLGSTLINLFPKSTLKYFPEDSAVPTHQ